MKPRWKKKQAGCPEWILEGVRRIRDQATQKPVTTTPTIEADSQADINHSS